MYIPVWLIFFIIGFLHSFTFALKRNDIFEWHADPGLEKRNSLVEKRVNLVNAPLFWKIEHFMHVFLGIAVGWILLWILIDKRLNLFNEQNFDNLNLVDLVLFLLGWIGINGRLPSIAHSIVDFMKSGPRS